MVVLVVVLVVVVVILVVLVVVPVVLVSMHHFGVKNIVTGTARQRILRVP